MTVYDDPSLAYDAPVRYNGVDPATGDCSDGYDAAIGYDSGHTYDCYQPDNGGGGPWLGRRRVSKPVIDRNKRDDMLLAAAWLMLGD